MEIDPRQAKEALQQIQKAQKIVIISHRNPDADTIGSNLALRQVFEKYGKQVISACVDALPANLGFLKNIEKYQQNFAPHEMDLIICVDAGSPDQAAFIKQYPDLFSGKIPVINIDHHASNNHYGTLNIVFPGAASTTIIIYHLLLAWGEKISKNMATCLLYGLYYDTGSFMHSNTSDGVYTVAGKLIEAGANLEVIVKNLFHHNSIDQLRLWGKVFSEAELTNKNVVVAGVRQEDFKKTATGSTDLSGAIDYLSMVKGNLFATIISEDGKGNIRGSLRTKKNDVNLSEIAGMLGGGGHEKASGFTFEGELKKEIRWSIK